MYYLEHQELSWMGSLQTKEQRIQTQKSQKTLGQQEHYLSPRSAWKGTSFFRLSRCWIPLLKFMLLEQTHATQSRSQSVHGDVGHCFREGHSGAKLLRSVVSSLFSATTICWRWFKNIASANSSVDAGSVAGSGAPQSDKGSVPTRRHQEEIWFEKIARSCRAQPWGTERAMRSTPSWVHVELYSEVTL